MGEYGRVRAGVTLLAVLSVLGAGPSASAAPGDSRVPRAGPAGNAFYVPRRVTPGQPGDVVWTSPIISPSGARAWKILYHSRGVDGRDALVSGIAITPTAKPPPSGWPVVTWAHGTEGLADACAASKALDIAYRLPGIQAFIKQGYAVVATDYQGLGTAGRQAYLVGVSEARGVLDIARAAHEMAPMHASTRVLVYGHSQGGQAALFAGQIAPTYAPDLRLLGVAAVAPVSDLTALIPEATATPIALGYAVMAVAGFHAAYPTISLASALTPEAIAGIGYLDQHCAADVIDHYAESTPSQIIAQSPLAVPAFAALLRQNTAGTVATPAPLFVAQGDRDELVPEAVTSQYVQRACGVGDHVVYRVYPGQDHVGARDASVKDIQAWMNARVAGQPAPSTC